VTSEQSLRESLRRPTTRAMDGIAVKAEETYRTPLKSAKNFEDRLYALWINTGQAMPEGINAVIIDRKNPSTG